MTLRILAASLLLALAAPALSGCAGVAAGAAAVGVQAVAEERTPGNQVDDLIIGLSINEKLFAHSERLFSDVSVDVTEGRVLLTGKVPTPGDRVDAVRLAWQAEGVAEVINEIRVTDTGSLEDYLRDVRISSVLRAGLVFDSDVSSINYNVETVDGIVFLTGVARSRAELDLVVQRARTIAGVREVISHVRVADG